MKEDPVMFLMANLGSEAVRLWRARDEGNNERMRGAYVRARDILKEIQNLLTAESARNELAVLQEVFDDAVREQPKFRIHSE